MSGNGEGQREGERKGERKGRNGGRKGNYFTSPSVSPAGRQLTAEVNEGGGRRQRMEAIALAESGVGLVKVKLEVADKKEGKSFSRENMGSSPAADAAAARPRVRCPHKIEGSPTQHNTPSSHPLSGTMGETFELESSLPPSGSRNASVDSSHRARELTKYRYIALAIAVVSVVYVIWFVAELIPAGIRSGGQFNILGISSVSVHIVIVAVAGGLGTILLRRASREAKELIEAEKKSSTGNNGTEASKSGLCMQITLPILCALSAAGYVWFYIPLQSNFVVWLVRWVPWVVLTFCAVCPCCHRGCVLGRQSAQDGRVSDDGLSTDAEKGGIPVIVDRY